MLLRFVLFTSILISSFYANARQFEIGSIANLVAVNNNQETSALAVSEFLQDQGVKFYGQVKVDSSFSISTFGLTVGYAIDGALFGNNELKGKAQIEAGYALYGDGHHFIGYLITGRYTEKCASENNCKGATGIGAKFVYVISKENRGPGSMLVIEATQSGNDLGQDYAVKYSLWNNIQNLLLETGLSNIGSNYILPEAYVQATFELFMMDPTYINTDRYALNPYFFISVGGSINQNNKVSGKIEVGVKLKM